MLVRVMFRVVGFTTCPKKIPNDAESVPAHEGDGPPGSGEADTLQFEWSVRDMQDIDTPFEPWTPIA
jgi:hypothetical protein